MKNLTLKEKYKNRKPEETIKIIEEFFVKKGCKIEEEKICNSEIGTFSHSYKLRFKNRIILYANGKGTTELYSKASAYGELYERFCGFQVLCHNNICYDKLYKNNLNKEYKILTSDDLLNNKLTKASLQYIYPSLKKDILNDYLKAKYGEQLIGFKYKNFNPNNEDMYCNPLIASYINGTTGLSAGNTIEEALIQGSSEIYERYCMSKIVSGEKEQFYVLNQNFLPDYIKDLISKMEEKGFELSIYDLSYTYCVPCVLIIAINKENHKLFRHYGSYPIIEIAIERCLTEMYQGFTSLDEEDIRKFLITPNDIDGNDIIDSVSSCMYIKEVINDDVFLNYNKVNTPNYKIFLPKADYTNEELMLQINLVNKINDINFYYLDLSLCDEIKAVQIIPSKPFGVFDGFFVDDAIENSKSISNYDNVIKLLTLLLKDLKTVSSNLNITDKEIENELNRYYSYIPNTSLEERYKFMQLVSCHLGYDITEPINCKNMSSIENNEFIIKYLLGEFEDIKINSNTKFAENIIPWNFYYIYCIKNKKSPDEFNAIMDKMGYGSFFVRDTDITPAVFIKYSLTNNLYNIYNDKDFLDFIDLFKKI